jgi:molecular chaperone GrpE
MAGKKKKIISEQALEADATAGEELPPINDTDHKFVEGPLEQSALAEEFEGQIDLKELLQERDEARARSDEYLDGWQRTMAEFANYKRRIEREQAQAYQAAAGNIIKRYLGVLDDLERALKNRPKDGDGAAWSEGVELIYRKFLAILESEGVKPIEADGQFFDPNYHEAILSEDNDHYQSGQVIEVLQQGYMLGDRVLRPAGVRVAR